MTREPRPPLLTGWFDTRVEEAVARARARGEFDDLPGAGRPLDLQDDALVPEDVRVAYRVLRNAGFVPPEVLHLREIGELERLVLAADDDAQRRRALARLNRMLARVAEARGGLAVDEACYRRLVERLASAPSSSGTPSQDAPAAGEAA